MSGKPKDGRSYTNVQAARILGVHEKTVTRWRVQGWIVDTSDGHLDVAATRANVNCALSRATPAEHEVWRPIPGMPGYVASSLGRIGSYHAPRRGYRDDEGGRGLHVLVSQIDHGHGLRISLWFDGKRRRFVVGRLVCLAFYGPPPPGMILEHLDCDVGNNQIENVRWAPDETRWANPLRRSKQSRVNHKWTGEEVNRIRRMYRMGKPTKEIARYFPGLRPANVLALACRVMKNDHLRPGLTEPRCESRGNLLKGKPLVRAQRYSDEVVVRVLNRHALGETVFEISQAEGIHECTVRNWIRGGPTGRPYVASDLRAAIHATKMEANHGR